jgi:hypothetical protein
MAYEWSGKEGEKGKESVEIRDQTKAAGGNSLGFL